MSLVFMSRYLMQSGLLSKTLNNLNLVFRLLTKEDSLIYFNKKRKTLNEFSCLGTTKSLFLNRDYLSHTETFSNLSSKLLSLKPIFHYYIYKVDKQIYKNSRGRSGKYTFLWKYLTPFKRINFIAFNLAKEIKTDYSKDLTSRILTCVLRYLNNHKNTLLARSIRFSNNYAFFSGRNTILQNFRTIKSS